MNSSQSTPSGNFDVFSSKRILIANDFSPAAIGAVVAGLRIAQRSGGELIVLNVEEASPCVPWGTPAHDYLVEQEAHHQKTRERLNAMLNEHLLPAARRTLPSIKVLAVDGDPATEIVKTAFDTRTDLIVIANHGCGRLKRLLLGGTAEKVVRYASCPVLVVRESKSELDLPPVHPAGELVA